ncbi:5-formyltetrahydrofolate cyclo-ligase [uncultured Corynebacterium sp.]|uniref:5-formyltetrahydrofolate cyclo-ligase n=1 Tax=uncultured Corynebacterium sp. TaxID=159447 RepID=UPI0025DBF59E|nr:5-formyltetrahydrofolate cyclo-ligase [uncultured Corynebacterium sp.]
MKESDGPSAGFDCPSGAYSAGHLIAEHKKLYRRQIRCMRRELSDRTLNAWDEQLLTQLITVIDDIAHSSQLIHDEPLVIATYLPVANEPGAHTPSGFIPSLLSALDDRIPCSIVIPRVEQLRRLSWHPWSPNNLVTTAFGIREPDERSTPIPFDTVDIAIVPALAYDIAGYRLGQGGGYYDCTLASRQSSRHSSPLHTIGLVHPHEILPTVPHDDWDVRLATVVTALGRHHVPRR